MPGGRITDRRYYARITNSDVQSTFGGEDVKIVLDEEVDSYGIEADTTNSRLIAPIHGRYKVTAQILTGIAARNDISIAINGAEFDSGKSRVLTAITNKISTEVTLTATQYVEAWLSTSAGSGSSVIAANLQPFLEMELIKAL